MHKGAALLEISFKPQVWGTVRRELSLSVIIRVSRYGLLLILAQICSTIDRLGWESVGLITDERDTLMWDGRRMVRPYGTLGQ